METGPNSESTHVKQEEEAPRQSWCLKGLPRWVGALQKGPPGRVAPDTQGLRMAQ